MSFSSECLCVVNEKKKKKKTTKNFRQSFSSFRPSFLDRVFGPDRQFSLSAPSVPSFPSSFLPDIIPIRVEDSNSRLCRPFLPLESIERKKEGEKDAKNILSRSLNLFSLKILRSTDPDHLSFSITKIEITSSGKEREAIEKLVVCLVKP